ncbi:hypothetical protein [Janthinobacterium sp. 17J80-10]|nr:hypothetical protein [Janthinobacterium sp. 17J80-10]
MQHELLPIQHTVFQPALAPVLESQHLQWFALLLFPILAAGTPLAE